MADTGSSQVGLIGNSITLSGPGTIKISGRNILDENGFYVAPVPRSSDLAALGSAALPWSDLFLASGGVLNFDNGNVVWTHSAGVWTLTTGALALGSHVATLNGDAVVACQRHRVTLAEMNNGHTILAAVSGLKYRLIDVKVIAVGGAMAATAAATGIAIYGTKATTVTALYTVLLAAGAENAVCQINTANTSVPAAGAFWTANDAATAITCKTVTAGAFDLITVQNIDVILTYCLEA